MIDSRVRFDEEYLTKTLYFTAPKELFSIASEYPEVTNMKVSIEFPIDHIEPEYANVSISPKWEHGSLRDCYDWQDIELPYDEIEEFIKLAGL